MILRPLLGSQCHWKCQNTMCSRKSLQFVTVASYFRLGRQTDALVGEMQSPGQRRLLPAPEPDHHDCWEVQVAVCPSVALSACELPPAPPAASWTNTERRWSLLIYTTEDIPLFSKKKSQKRREYKVLFSSSKGNFWIRGHIWWANPALLCGFHVVMNCWFSVFPSLTFSPKPLVTHL